MIVAKVDSTKLLPRLVTDPSRYILYIFPLLFNNFFESSINSILLKLKSKYKIFGCLYIILSFELVIVELISYRLKISIISLN
jgi:hypothetical protein